MVFAESHSIVTEGGLTISGEEGDGGSVRAGTACATDAVDVILRVVGVIVVQHVGDVANVFEAWLAGETRVYCMHATPAGVLWDRARLGKISGYGISAIGLCAPPPKLGQFQARSSAILGDTVMRSSDMMWEPWETQLGPALGAKCMPPPRSYRAIANDGTRVETRE